MTKFITIFSLLTLFFSFTICFAQEETDQTKEETTKGDKEVRKPKEELEMEFAFKECGIGAMVFPTYKIGAVISNIIWDFGTTASSSSSSSPDTCNGRPEMSAAVFTLRAFAQLSEETSQGQGPHLQVLLGLVGCSVESHSKIIEALRQEFQNTLATEEYRKHTVKARAEDYYNLLNEIIVQHPHFQHQCGGFNPA